MGIVGSKTRRYFALTAAAMTATGMLALALVLFFAPLRDAFFNSNLWPWPLASDISPAQIATIRSLAEPGDVVVETNLHYWQWVALSRVTTGSTWVHTSIVDEERNLITMDTSVASLPFGIFLKWHSTRLGLVRPPYSGRSRAAAAIRWARSQINTPYDPSFKNPAGSCTGLVAVALQHGGIAVPKTTTFGASVFAAATFFAIPGARLIWSSDR